jgi:glycosyltransferase involved in cell wall biosynthesis
MKKVAFCYYDSPHDVSGVSSWLQRLLPRLQGAGFEVEVHVLGAEGVNCATFARLGIPYRLCPFEPDITEAARNCLRMIEASQPDIYVPNCILPAYYAAAYARQQGVRTVGVLHSDDPFYWGIVDEFINGSAAFRLSSLVAVSSFLREAVAASAQRNNIITRRIGCGVPLTRERAQRCGEVFRLVYTGRLEEEQKRISEVARALCAVVKQNPGVEAWIVGEGSARPEAERIIQTSGVDPMRVRLLGRVDNASIYSVLRQCHAFVLLSDYEGLPVSMLEAMACGVVPVCLEMRSGIREAIQPGVNGMIVRDRWEDFYAAVQTLKNDPSRWSKLSANARDTVKESFSEETCAAAWIELLGSLVKKRQSGATKIPVFIRLPRRNPKFGNYDQRTPLLRKSWNNARIALGYYRRKLFKSTGGAA